MARPGYTNIRPTAERDRLFNTIAAAQGMDAQVHKHRVEMIDQGLRLLAQKTKRGETMASKWTEWMKPVMERADYTLPMSQDLSDYGSEATQDAVQEYAAWAKRTLEARTGHAVRIEFVGHVPDWQRDPEMNELQEMLWQEYCNL